MRSNVAPFTYYIVKPRGQTARVFASLAQASAAITRLAPTPVEVSAITGARRRSLTVSERYEVSELCRTRGARPQLNLPAPQPQSSQMSATVAPVSRTTA